MTSPQPSGGNGQAPTATTGGNGQAPTAGANMGQASTSHDGTLQSGNGQAPTAPGGTPSQDASERIRALEAEAAEARREAAANRAAKTELEKLRQAAMTEEEKREAARVKLEADHKVALSELQDYRLRFAALTDGADIGLTTPKAVDAALKLMDRAALEFDAAGKPTNLPKVLAATVKEYPFLASAASGAAPATPQRPAASSGGATNPGTGGQSAGDVTWQQYAAMSQAERTQPQMWARITQTLARNNGRFPGQP